MKKVYSALISILIMTTIIPLGKGGLYAVEAESLYPMSCPLYELSYIEDDGSLSAHSCYDSFEAAKNKMYEIGGDYVVRHADGYSPTKIVAMRSGLVYSYPRGSSSTQNIYESYNDRYDYTYTYVSRYYEMTYVDTPYMSAISGHEGQGWVHVILNGFDGYADIEYTDLVPSKFIKNSIPIYLGGSYAYNSSSPYKTICVPNYYVVKRNGNYDDLEFHYHVAYPASSSDIRMGEYTIKVSNAESYPFLERNVKYFSDDGINFYTDFKKKEFVGKAYNYYQYLPLRSKSKISAATLDSFLISTKGSNTDSKLKNEGASFIDSQNAYGCNAAIVYAMACLESAYGTSGYAKNRNNLFGWNAYDDSPDDASYFSSIRKCVEEQMGRNLRKYMDVTDWRFNGPFVGNKGSGFNLEYASDPYWGAKIASIYYAIDKYDNSGNGNLTDYNSYDLGVINKFNAPVYKIQSSSNILYTSSYTSTRQENHVVILLSEDGGKYKIQSNNPVFNNNIYSGDEICIYDWSSSVGYVQVNNIEKITNNGLMTISHESLTMVDDLSIDGNVLHIEGFGGFTNMNFDDPSSIKHTLQIYDYADDSLCKEIECGLLDTSYFSINDGYSYSNCGFEVDVDLSQLENGSYYLKLKTENRGFSLVSNLSSVLKEHSLIIKDNEGLTYRLCANAMNGYRLELDIMAEIMELKDIVKPSIRDSLVAFDDITIDEEGNLNIEGIAMMFYLNYGDGQLDGIENSVYLLGEEEAIKMESEASACSLDYKSIYESSYDLKNICFKAKTSIKDLRGKYRIMMKMINGDYMDICEMTNRYNEQLPSLDIEGTAYKVDTDKIRYRITLDVE